MFSSRNTTDFIRNLLLIPHPKALQGGDYILLSTMCNGPLRKDKGKNDARVLWD